MSSVGPVSPEHTPHKAESTAKVGKGSHNAEHKWGNMTFTQQQWHMFMKTMEQNIGLEIKKENSQWKRQNQRMREMWSGG